MGLPKKSFVYNRKWYVSVDSTGTRIIIPKIFLLPSEWKSYKGYYMGGNKIYYEAYDPS